MGAAAERTLSNSERAEQKARAVRLDPKTRPLDGAMPWTKLKNRDPRRCYVWAPEQGVNPGEFDVPYYLAMHENVGALPSDGWMREELRSDGPQPTAGVTVHPGPDGKPAPNQPVTFRGNTLLSCPREFKALIDAIGDDGSSGQRGADFMDRLYKKRGAYTDTKRIKTAEGITVEKDPRGSAGDSDVTERVEGLRSREEG